MIPIDLNNRVAVITGGSGALGRVMVRTLAEAGSGYRNLLLPRTKKRRISCEMKSLP